VWYQVKPTNSSGAQLRPALRSRAREVPGKSPELSRLDEHVRRALRRWRRRERLLARPIQRHRVERLA
jgi:hypothetical protein